MGSAGTSVGNSADRMVIKIIILIYSIRHLSSNAAHFFPHDRVLKNFWLRLARLLCGGM
jgi:hypothetical protein